MRWIGVLSVSLCLVGGCVKKGGLAHSMDPMVITSDDGRWRVETIEPGHPTLKVTDTLTGSTFGPLPTALWDIDIVILEHGQLYVAGQYADVSRVEARSLHRASARLGARHWEAANIGPIVSLSTASDGTLAVLGLAAEGAWVAVLDERLHEGRIDQLQRVPVSIQAVGMGVYEAAFSDGKVRRIGPGDRPSATAVSAR